MTEELERVVVFIDGNNFYYSIKKILKPDERVDYQKLVDVLVGDRMLVKTFYYIAPLDKSVDYKKYEKHQKFLEELKKISKFNVVLCDFKKIKTKDGNFFYVVKGDDVQLAQDLLLGAFDNLYDAAIIVSGDEDFFPLIKTVRERFKKRVENAFFRHSSSYKLRQACDYSFKLNNLVSQFLIKKDKTSSSATVR